MPLTATALLAAAVLWALDPALAEQPAK
jgi:hypothetical protein